MRLGRTPNQRSLLSSSSDFCRDLLPENSVYSLLERESHRIFPDEAFADLFHKRGRSCVPPRIVAVVMALQRAEGLSDREAVDRFAFDLRWKYAAGGVDYKYPGFVHTVLVDMRARLRNSK
ncbi:MAG: transposase, partial [Myxococcales bacterium]|nr:transposase [Myxococcales bacterium]